MPILHIMCGIPGSGKSTLALRIKGRIVSTDEIRKHTQNNNKVFEIAREANFSWLRQGHDVIFDATNTTRSSREALINIGKRCGARVIIHYIKCPLIVAIERNQSRKRKVPNAAIKSFYVKFEEPKTEEGFDEILVYDLDLKLQRTIVFSSPNTTCRSNVIAFPLSRDSL